MAHALPFLKLGVLLVKQASKPLARFVKAKATTNERVGRICHFTGQFWHSSTTRVHYMVQGHRVKTVKPLNEQEAIQSGSELLSDGFVLSVGVGALILEAKRSARSAADKAAQKTKRQHAKIEAMMHLDVTLKDLAEYTRKLHDCLEEADVQHRLTHKRPLIENLPAMPIALIDFLDNEHLDPTEAIAIKQIKLENGEGDDHATAEKKAWIDAGKSTWSQIMTEGISKLIRALGATWSGDGDDDWDIDMDADDAAGDIFSDDD